MCFIIAVFKARVSDLEETSKCKLDFESKESILLNMANKNVENTRFVVMYL